MEEYYDEQEPCTCRDSDCSGFKYWQTDPFQVEINENHELYFMCDGEAWESAMDI